MVRASGIRGYASVMRDLGADPAALLRRYRIAAASLDRDDALISVRAVTQLLEASSKETRCGDLGLRIAQNQDISVLGPLGIVVRNATTPMDAFHYASRYMFIHSPGLDLLLTPSTLIEGAIELTLKIKLPGNQAQRQNIDLCLGTAHRISKMLLGEHHSLKAVTLPHAPIAPLSIYRRFFGTSVIANQECAALHLDSSGWRIPLRGGNPALREITEDFLDRHFRAPGSSVSTRVQMALRRMLGTPQANKTDVAAMLALHPRTLHRRLEMEGTSFEVIREELRKDIAMQYLRETEVPLSQLSAILGFPEQSAFTRSFRRWLGTTPSAFRASKKRAK